jgi:16S rRNA (guanine527-N7)-methyltransferase
VEERLDRREAPPTRVSESARLALLPRDPASLPGLPAAFGRALDDGLAVLGLDLAPGVRAAIEAHVRLLLAWNAAINLTAITDPASIATRHVVDSLTALPWVGDPPPRLVDLGSGAGFPGLPLAAAIPGARLTLVDSVAKKTRFLEAVVAATGLADRVSVRTARAEALPRDGAWNVVVARAVGSLADLVELAMPLLPIGGRLIAWKRGDIGSELAAAARAGAAIGARPPEVRPVRPIRGLEGHVLVEVVKAAPTPPGLPRDPAVRRRRPW